MCKMAAGPNCHAHMQYTYSEEGKYTKLGKLSPFFRSQTVSGCSQIKMNCLTFIETQCIQQGPGAREVCTSHGSMAKTVKLVFFG